MAARLQPFHDDAVRKKIRASQLVEHIQAVAFEEKTVSRESLRASEILLRKVLPDLSQVQMETNVDGKVELTWQK